MSRKAIVFFKNMVKALNKNLGSFNEEKDKETLMNPTSVADLSIWSLVSHADFTSLCVMLVLLGASFWSWAIIFTKWTQLKKLKRSADQFEETFWSGGSLDELYDRIGRKPRDPMSAVFVSAMAEWRLSHSKGFKGSAKETLKERLERIMQVAVSREVEMIESNMGFLASVGSTAPFIGLFGTVWGIMNSFRSIAISENTSLAVVAPGIAEALFATALGLVAAIPAVLAYNKLSSEVNRYASRLEAFAQEFNTIISRQLEEGA